MDDKTEMSGFPGRLQELKKPALLRWSGSSAILRDTDSERIN